MPRIIEAEHERIARNRATADDARVRALGNAARADRDAAAAWGLGHKEAALMFEAEARRYRAEERRLGTAFRARF